MDGNGNGFVFFRHFDSEHSVKILYYSNRNSTKNQRKKCRFFLNKAKKQICTQTLPGLTEITKKNALNNSQNYRYFHKFVGTLALVRIEKWTNALQLM